MPADSSGGGSENATARSPRGGCCQVPAGGSHHGPVQTPQYCAAVGCGHCWEAGELGGSYYYKK